MQPQPLYAVCRPGRKKVTESDFVNITPSLSVILSRNPSRGRFRGATTLVARHPAHTLSASLARFNPVKRKVAEIS